MDPDKILTEIASASTVGDWHDLAERATTLAQIVEDGAPTPTLALTTVKAATGHTGVPADVTAPDYGQQDWW